MTTFDKREQAAEAKLAHDEELKFKVLARRNQYLGRWAANILGMTGQKAEDYARCMLAAQLRGQEDVSVFQKIRADFDAAKIARPDSEIRREMDNLLARATKEVTAGMPIVSPKDV
jgi:hypothetical protein